MICFYKRHCYCNLRLTFHEESFWNIPDWNFEGKFTIISEGYHKSIFFYIQRNFHYDSKLWTNKNDFNLPAGKTLLDHQETKLPSYWNSPFSKISLAMKIGHEVNSIVISNTLKP